MRMLKYIKYLGLIIVIIMSLLLTTDISFAEELLKPEEVTKGTFKTEEVWREESQVLASLEKIGEVVWNYKYIIIGTTLVGLVSAIIIYDINSSINTPLLTPDYYKEDIERILTILKETPNPKFQSFQQAIYIYPELQKTVNSELLPWIIESKYTFCGDVPYVTTDGTWQFINLFVSNDNVIYRVYMDYSVPITTVDSGMFYEGSCVITNVVLLDPVLIQSAPYTMIEVLQVDTAKATVDISKTIFVKRH